MSFDPSDIQAQLRQTLGEFASRFGRPATFAAVAPGRVNLIGEHTDYNQGFVLPMAIERQTLIVAARQAQSVLRLVSTSEKQPAFVRLDSPLQPGEPAWANYVKGVVAGCMSRGLSPGGFDALIDTTVPVGGGLSSSAALEVASATLVEALAGRVLDRVEKALLCQEAEHVFAGVPCGIMDPFISTMAQAGHAMLLDCRTHQTTMAPLDDPGVVVLIANSNIKHELTGGEYAQRRQQCEAAAKILCVDSLRDADMAMVEAARARLEPDQFKRARHVVGEIARTLDAAKAADRGDWPAMGQLMFQSHASLRDDFQVSCQELDILVELARELVAGGDVIGSRMTGGGFGGCTVSLVRAASLEKVMHHLDQGYHRRTGIQATLFATRPAQGARVLPL